MPKNFALIGVAGYIAPRHLQAIKDTGNRLAAALDPCDSVGILDQYSDDAAFFTDQAAFERFVLERAGTDDRIDWMSVCTPNDLHESSVRLAFRLGADVICEKPLALTPESLDAIAAAEKAAGRRVSTILQLRHHPTLLSLYKSLNLETAGQRHDVVLTYVTPRGPWYHTSWKGHVERSGGLATNIGIHFFDLLIWLFGPVQSSEVHVSQPNRVSGVLDLKHASVQWFLSIDRHNLPHEAKTSGRRAYRSLTVDGKTIEFSDGFADLHTQVYRSILSGKGFGIQDVRPSIELATEIRNSPPIGTTDRSHSMIR